MTATLSARMPSARRVTEPLERLTEAVRLTRSQRALVTILDEDPAPEVDETARLSELALAEDWGRPEEDEAWSHLQGAR